MKLVQEFYVDQHDIGIEASRRSVADHRAIPSIIHFKITDFMGLMGRLEGLPGQFYRKTPNVTYLYEGREFTSPMNGVPEADHTVTGYELFGQVESSVRPILQTLTLKDALGMSTVSNRIKAVIEYDIQVSIDGRDWPDLRALEKTVLSEARDGIYSLQDSVVDRIMGRYIGEPAPEKALAPVPASSTPR